MRSASRLRVCLIVAVLLAAFAGQAVVSMRQKSVTVDELVYITAGYYHLTTGDFRFNMTNPPMMKLIAAAPLLLLKPQLPETTGDLSEFNEIEQWQYARRFHYDNIVDADTLLFASRLPVVLLGVILGFFVFRWSRELYGTRAGLLALLLFAFSPNLLAHTRLATQDLGLTAFLFLGAYAFWKYVERPSLWRLLAAGLLLSAALVTKSSAFFAAPAFLAFCAIVILGRSEHGVWEGCAFVARIDRQRIRTRQFASFAAACLVLAAVIAVSVNAAYLFQGTFQPVTAYLPAEKIQERLATAPGPARLIAGALIDLPLPAPEALVQMVRFQATRVSSGNVLYLAGETSREGWHYHMPLAFLMKTPIPMLLLTVAALWLVLRRRDLRPVEWLFLLVIATFMALFAYLKGVAIGLRYILPLYPFLFVFVSRLARDSTQWTRTTAVALAALLVWYVAGTLRVHPNYLAYFNESVGGPSNGYKYLVDSYLDWGQDLKLLKRYMEKNDIERIRLAYFGSGDARYYGIDYDYLPSIGLAPVGSGDKWWFERGPGSDLPPFEITDEPLAISATLWAGVFYPGYYEPLRAMEPDDQVGHSILIYRGRGGRN
ncbi:glycosyltransferase family 39 protein [Ferruginivarius sediminum]|nr:glycosyltransferase family 39 protein [Ferruginivarius sediminum]